MRSAPARSTALRLGLVTLLLGAGCPRAGAKASTAWPSKVHGRAVDDAGEAQQKVLEKKEATRHAAGGGGTSGASEGSPRVRLGVPGAEYATADDLWLDTSNAYPRLANSAWANLAEPFRDTTLTAGSSVGDPDRDVFKWSFEDGTVLEGREVTYMFKGVGAQTVSLAQTMVSTGRIVQIEDSVMVKYVRREVRQLKAEDREAFLDAMEKLYRLPTEEGVALYGDDYKGISFFVQMHLDGAGVSDCDHWHDDAGIMTHHVGYTMLFEQALQVVDPSVTIPYWEYTIEYSQGLTDYGESQIFAPDWFGDASPNNAMHTVDNGRWAYLPVMQDAWDYVHNPYGLLRTPWNTDPTPYVTRHNMTNAQDITGVVTCGMYQNCFDETTLAGLFNCLNGGTHGPVHIKMGGEWNNPEEELTNSLGYADEVPLMAKFLWRKGYLRMPTSCTEDEHGTGDDSTCRASCPSEIYENLGMTPYDVLYDALSIHWVAGKSGGVVVWDEEKEKFYIAGHEDDVEFEKFFWLRILNSLCDPGHVGELYTSSAPYDPLFWVIHPTAERFMGWRRKLGVEQPDMWPLDETWDYSHGWVVGETGTVCDWDDVREGSLDMPTCRKGICGGHGADDLLPFKVKVKGETMQMTNLQWYQFIYPDNDDLPYMYNEYQWDHCASSGNYMGTNQDGA
ncbi:Hypothetical Protein RRSL_02205 [Ectocarpus siliculosus]|uniref:PKD domain-containing protein n=1 Tax=Ectocarpus siliculosus TaxID=2880 RepID=D7G0J9_ECTSI|nr:Hypothetical Protein RRSL_02205 [Ectocarpus siliculosus]|eukprot:CBJ33028.1 Hypothetical Protein RRSL_02205 [Ectocarpus siliculosus]